MTTLYISSKYTAEPQRVVKDGADNPLGSIKKTALRLWCHSLRASSCHIPGDFHSYILDEGEFDLHILHPLVLNLFLDGAQPCYMTVKGRLRKGRRASVFAFSNFSAIVAKVMNSDVHTGSEVCRVAEKDYPASLIVIGKLIYPVWLLP
jgi:hypothetical protein